jgi:hypothetical protein
MLLREMVNLTKSQLNKKSTEQKVNLNTKQPRVMVDVLDKLTLFGKLTFRS